MGVGPVLTLRFGHTPLRHQREDALHAARDLEVGDRARIVPARLIEIPERVVDGGPLLRIPVEELERLTQVPSGVLESVLSTNGVAMLLREEPVAVAHVVMDLEVIGVPRQRTLERLDGLLVVAERQVATPELDTLEAASRILENRLLGLEDGSDDLVL